MNNNFDKLTSREQLDVLAEFAAGAGHEINNPLAIIMGHAQTLLTRVEDESIRRSLGQICAQVRRAHEMIADLRLLSRPPKPESKQFSLGVMLKEISILAHVKLENFLSPECDKVFSDATQLRVALDALIKNASEAILSQTNAVQENSTQENAGIIQISCDAYDCENYTKKMILICVDDNGPGVPQEIRSLIWNPYFSGRQAGRGLGFGLCKAWRIIDQLGGTLTLEESKFGGARFEIRLPQS